MKRRRSFAVLIALVGMLVAIGVGSAFSKTTLASPTLSSTPAAATMSRSASFSFSGPAGATFTCSLDGASATACTSPKTYSSLPDATHVFSVVAVKAGDQSAPTSYSWQVDNVAPVKPAISLAPATMSSSTSASFTFGGSESGLTFTCSRDGSSPVACISPTSYSGLAQGQHTFAVRAIDAAGNVSDPGTWAWTVDTVAPPAPTLTGKPSDPTPNATNDFVWTVAEAGTTSECSLENGSWFTCSSPYRWVIDTSNNGQHQFAVRSRDAAGNVSSATQYTFKYQKGLPTSGMPFQITGSVSGLTIGNPKDISVTVTNPNSVQIYVSALTVALPVNSTPTGCTSAQNLQLQQSNISSGLTLIVPPNGSVTLPAQGVTAPSLLLKNLPTVNQDVCKGKSFALTYSGTATN